MSEDENNDDNFQEYTSQQESDEDLGPIGSSDFSSVAVSGNDWTTETIINQINKGNIQLNPEFQRREAWDLKRKSKFIESLILGLPIPQVVLAESKDRRGSYIVLDGKQRLLSIRQFAAMKNDAEFKQLKLSSLDIRKDLVGQTLESMHGDLALFDDLSSFENQPIRTVVIKNWRSEDFLYTVFLRLNTGSVPLSPQELRQALHPGEFVRFLDQASGNSEALQEILKIKDPDFRMRDAELLLRYLAFKNFLLDYRGQLKNFLDSTCEKLNAGWDTCESAVKQDVVEFEAAHSFLKTIFGKNIYRKWLQESSTYETRFNRSLFDVMMLAFSNPEIRRATEGKEAQVEEAFREVCSAGSAFRSSVESTTKSIGATNTRIEAWFTALRQLLDVELRIPQIEE